VFPVCCLDVIEGQLNMAAAVSFYSKAWNTYEEFSTDFTEFCSFTKQVFSVIDLHTVPCVMCIASFFHKWCR
jgi:hypothetical protein